MFWQKDKEAMEQYTYEGFYRDTDADGVTVEIACDVNELSDMDNELRAHRVMAFIADATVATKPLTEYFYISAALPSLPDKAREERIAEVNGNHIIALANEIRIQFKELKASM